MSAAANGFPVPGNGGSVISPSNPLYRSRRRLNFVLLVVSGFAGLGMPARPRSA